MTPLAAAYVATAAICLVVALQHLVLAFRVPERRIHMLFAVAAGGVAGDAFVSRATYGATHAHEFLGLMPFGALFIVTTIVALSLFIAFRTRAVRMWMVVLVAILGIATVVIDFTTGIAYVGPVDFNHVTLFWGESFALPSGETNPLRLIADLTLIGFLVVLLDTTVRLVRRGDRRAAWLIGGSLVVYSLSLFMIIPVDMGRIHLPSLHTFAFLIIVAAMSWDLSDELIRASRLSREVIAGERRWRQLLNDVQLLVVEIDLNGLITFMNPFAEQVSGNSAGEMIGRYYLEFVNDNERNEVEFAVERGLDGDPASENERTLVTHEGEQRSIRWRSVMLRDVNGNPEGLLSIGADVTERRRSEARLEHTSVELEATVRELEAVRTKLEEENVYLKEEIGARAEHSEIIGSSDALLYVLHKIKQVAATDATVLIQGETGVGKELVANTIHQEGDRAAGPFIALNCAALPANLVESELFGHEKGAFTDADRLRKGRFELADGGTLFLDEVGELPLEIQPKLLRVLQDGLVDRVGGSEAIKVDVRVIVATNRELRSEIDAGRFREDLYYRLDVFPITVPPLRDRREDIELLVRHFAGLLAARHKVLIHEVPQEVMRQLEAYDWPGNVRELQNVIERAVLTSSDGVLKLVGPLDGRSSDPQPSSARENGRLRTLEDVERSHIEEILRVCGGQIAGSGGAAEILGLHPNTLRSRLNKLGIKISK